MKVKSVCFFVCLFLRNRVHHGSNCNFFCLLHKLPNRDICAKNKSIDYENKNWSSVIITHDHLKDKTVVNFRI